MIIFNKEGSLFKSHKSRLLHTISLEFKENYISITYTDNFTPSFSEVTSAFICLSKSSLNGVKIFSVPSNLPQFFQSKCKTLGLILHQWLTFEIKIAASSLPDRHPELKKKKKKSLKVVMHSTSIYCVQSESNKLILKT